jgi:hypothetical protein
MDATSASELSAARLGMEISYRVAGKQQDAAQQQGDAAIALLQAAAQTQEQTNRAALAKARGGVDTLA